MSCWLSGDVSAKGSHETLICVRVVGGPFEQAGNALLCVLRISLLALLMQIVALAAGSKSQSESLAKGDGQPRCRALLCARASDILAQRPEQWRRDIRERGKRREIAQVPAPATTEGCWHGVPRQTDQRMSPSSEHRGWRML